MASLEELWVSLRRAGQESLAPLLIRHGVTSTNQLALAFDRLLQAGAHQWQLEAVLASAPDGVAGDAAASHSSRRDLPSPVVGKRASIQAALEAARPNQRQRSLEILDRDILAKSTTPANEARVRTYLALMRAWELPAFPLDSSNIRAFGASMKAGGYRSCAVYFSAVCSHQQRVLQTPISALVKLGIRDCIRSIQRGLGTSRLKDSFDGMLVSQIQVDFDESPFDFDRLGHSRDMVVIGLWFMMREAEMANARSCDLQLHGREVQLTLPVHKTEQQGKHTLRTLTCSCGARMHPLCVWHSSERHLIRVEARASADGLNVLPLFPTSEGTMASKQTFIDAFRMVIQATGTNLTRLGPDAQELQRFQGHVLRVAGAQMLSAAGIEVTLIQLLGRWTSTAVMKYTQDSALVRVPTIPGQVLQSSPSPPTVLRLVPAGQQAPADPTAESSSPPEKSPRPKAAASAMRSLRAELEMLKESIARPVETYVFRPRAKILHKASRVERDNEPLLWRTACGWNYGTSNFLRTTDPDAGIRQCRKCFDLDESSSSDNSDDSSDVADLDESSDESAAA